VETNLTYLKAERFNLYKKMDWEIDVVKAHYAPKIQDLTEKINRIIEAKKKNLRKKQAAQKVKQIKSSIR
jgi:hypothetical protein